MKVRTIAVLLFLVATSRTTAQVGPVGPRALSKNIQIDQVDSATRLQLERAAALLAEHELDDALDVYHQLIQESGARLSSTTPKPSDFVRYEPLRVQLQIWLMQRDRAILTRYRQRIRDETVRLFRDTDRRHREQNLTRIVKQFFLSRVADEALLELGDLALERNQVDRARFWWESIHPGLRYRQLVPAGSPTSATVVDQPLWIRLALLKTEQDWSRIADEMSTSKAANARLVYPDSDVPIADVRARLVLASILAGQRRRAELELRLFAKLHARAEGRLGGKVVNYVAALEKLLADSGDWPPQDTTNDWVTFAGNARRSQVASNVSDITAVAWRKSLVRPLRRAITTIEAERDAGIPVTRVAERQHSNFSVHPIVHNQTVFFSEGDRIRAFDLATGASRSAASDGEIYPAAGVREIKKPQMSVPIGTPRYTLSATDRFLLARLGTSMPQPGALFQPIQSPNGYLVALDRRSLRLTMQLNPDDETWSFEGTPIADRQGQIYVAMRRRGVNSQLNVACFDVTTQRQVWRTEVVAADSLGAGRVDEISNNVLTLASDTVFVNSNLGAVAALDARGGVIQWLIRYPRRGTDLSTSTQPADHVFRDLTPCVYHAGLLYVAPSDYEQVFAVDAMRGTILWHTDIPRGAFDAVHLLGVSRNHLLVSGRRLWWIDRLTGKLSKRIDQNPFPASAQSRPLGLGRGVLAGEVVLWPARGATDVIYFIEESTGRQLRQPIALENFNAAAGNLVVAGDRLLIATSQELIAMKIQTD